MPALAPLALVALAALHVGDVAPDFNAKDTSGAEVSLQAMLPRGPVVLAFFPRPFTPGCSQEMAALHRASAALKARGAQVVAISRSNNEKMADFKSDRGADFPFVADDGRLIKLYDVEMKPLGMSKRVTFVVTPKGSISHIFRGGEAIDPAALLQALPPL